MLPVTIMPLAALLKGIGYWIDPIGWGVNNPFAAFLILSGGVVIDYNVDPVSRTLNKKALKND